MWTCIKVGWNCAWHNICWLIMHIKASFSFHKLIPKALKWLPYILICHCTSLSPWFIILDKTNFENVFHHYLTSGGYQVWLKPMPCGLIDIYWVKCTQSNSHTSLTCSYFLLSYANQAMTKSCPLVVMVIWFAWVIREEFFLPKFSRRLHRDLQKFIFFHINKNVQEIVIMNDLEWQMLSYYVFYYEKFKKVMQRTEKEALPF